MSQLKIIPVKGYDSFTNAYKSGIRFWEKNCHASFTFYAPGTFYATGQDKAVTGAIVHYGVSIGKKRAKKAVVRNRIKRLLRESIRICAPEYGSPDEGYPFEKCIFIWKNAPGHPKQIRLADVLPEVERLFKMAHSHYQIRIKGSQN